MEVIAGEEDAVQLKGEIEVQVPYYELVYPNGETEFGSAEVGDTHTVAWSGKDGPLYVFEDEQLVTTLELKVWNALPTKRGYIAIIHGIHQDAIFSIHSIDSSEMVLQRKVGVARGLAATPDERYIATWRLSDETVYIYDVVEEAEAGRFQTGQLDAGNINLYGRRRDEQEVFEIEDKTADEMVGLITVDGDFLG
jgi:hypothetical protein